MTSRLLLWISLLLNLGLGATIFHAKYQRQPAPIAPSSVPTIAIPVPIAAEPVAETRTNQNATAPTTQVEAFSWIQLVSRDFKTYRDNLFAINCPTQTVHEIMLAVINHDFRERRDLLTASFQPRFWDAAALGKSALKSLAEPVAKLGEERDTVIEEVLGGEEIEDPETLAAQETNRWTQTYAWLPPEKQAQMTALEIEKRERQRELWQANRTSLPHTDDGGAHEKATEQLEAEFATRRKQVLTAEEDQELTLRNSGAAHWAGNIPGFEVSEAEWRSVAQLKLEYDKVQKNFMPFDEEFRRRYGTPAETGGGTAPDPAVQAQLKNELNAAMKSVLGDQRFAEYELGSDGNYRQTQRITARYGLPDSLAKQAYDLQTIAMNQAGQLRADTSLNAEARAAALLAIRQESERSLLQSLGPKVFKTYQEYHGNWLNQVDQAPEE